VFTGIVEELGEVADLTDLGDSVRLTLRGRRGTRTAWLTRAEFRVLCGSATVRAVLGAAAGEG